MAEEDKEELGDAIKEFNRGLNSHIEGKLDIALKHFEAALPTFKEYGVEDMIAGTFHEMGMVLQEQGELDKALDYYQRSLELSGRIHYDPGCARTFFQMGTLYEEKGDIITANDHYQKAKAYKTKKPTGLTIIIMALIFGGFWGIGAGILGISGALVGFEPTFIPAAQWEDIVTALTDYGGLLLVIGVLSLPAGIGLRQLKGWGWMLGIFVSILTILAIYGIIFYWYLSKENIQELYDVK